MKTFDKEALLGKWKDISTTAQKTFQDKISATDLEKVKGNVNMMVGLVQEKLGVSKEEAQKKVEELFTKFTSAELKTKAEVTAGKVLETANVLLDAVKDKIQKK